MRLFMKFFSFFCAALLTVSGLSAQTTHQTSEDKCMEGFSIEGEFLWWRAQMDNLDYALKSKDTISLAVPVITSTKVKDPNFTFDPGVRLSAGYNFGPSNWDFFLSWTYHYTDVTSEVGNANPPLTVGATKDVVSSGGVFVITFADTGKVKWQNRLNMFDLETGYDYCVSNRFALRPFMGIKGVWIDMDYWANYKNDTSSSGTFDLQAAHKSDFWGVGPQIGIQGYLYMGAGFSFYSTTSAALVYGEYNTTFKQTTSRGGKAIFKHDNFARQRAIGTIAIGLEWNHCFSDTYLLNLHIGWEGQQFWNQNQFEFNPDFFYSGDLTYTGLDVGISFQF